MAVVGTAQVLIVPTFSGLQKAIGKGLVKPLQDHTGTRSAGERIGDRVIGGMGKALKAGAVGTIAGASALVGTALVSGFNRLQAIEQAEAKLAGLGHTTEGVEIIMNDALAAVKGTSFGMGEAATTAASVVAAGVKPGEELQRTLTLVGDAATIAGVGMDEMGSIVNKVATSDMMQMDVANQLMDAGIPILQMVGEEMGVTAEEARKMASDGEISFETFQNALETGVGGAAQESGNTLQGAFKNTVASLGRIGASLLTPLYEAGKGFFNWAMDMLGPIEEWAESLAPKIESVLQGFVGWIKSDLIPAAQRIGDVLSAVAGWVQRNKDYLTPLGVALGVVVGAWVAWYTAIGIWNRIVGIATKVQKAFNFIMNANPILRIASIILAVGAALVWFFTKTETGQRVWESITAFFQNKVVPVFQAVGDFFVSIGEWFGRVVENIKGAWGELKAAFSGGDDGFGFLQEMFGPKVAEIAVNTFGFIGDAIQNVKGIIGEIMAAFGGGDEGYGFLAELFGDGVAQFIVGTMGWMGDTLRAIIDGIVAGWDWLVDAVAFAWNNILKPTWDVIAATAQWLWTAVLFVVFAAIWTAWQVIMLAMKAAWEFILKPTWDAISTAALWLWDYVLKPVFGWIQAGWELLMLGIEWYWNNVLKPVWNLISTVAQWLWNNVLKNVFTWIQIGWQLMILGIQFYWNNVLKPVWDAITTAATWLWENVLKPVFTWIGDQWQRTLQGMKNIWNNVLKPTWDALVSAAEWLWNNVLSPIFGWIGEKWDNILRGMKIVWEDILKPAFDKLGEVVQGLRDKFDTAVENIGKAWDKLKEIAAVPIHFVIQRVLNEGLIAGFNNTLGKIPGVNKLGDIAVPKWMKKYGYASGGYTGDGHWQDAAGVVHKGEFVLRKKATQKLRARVGLHGLDHMNRTGEFPGYSGGGLVQPVRGPLTSRFGASRGRYPHAGVDWAVPIGTPVRAALAGTALGRQPAGRTGRYVFLSHPGNRNTYYGHLSRPMVSAGDEVAKGQVIGLSGNTGNSTGPHLHFETWTGGKPVDPLSYMGGLPASDSDGGGGFDPLAPFRAIRDKILGWVKDKFPGAGPFVDAGVGVVKKSFTDIVDRVKSILGFGGDSDGDGGSGPAKDQVKDVATKFGWADGNQWTSLSKLIQRESSWNPDAANPTSSARGLFQKMTSIHGPLEKTAAGQAEWGLKYIKDRYGSPAKALAFHDRNNWYDRGGLVDDPSVLFRDRGGILPPGLSMVLNKTGQNEAILNHRQWSDIHKLATSSAASGSGDVHVHGDMWTSSPREVAQELARERRRAAATALPV